MTSKELKDLLEVCNEDTTVLTDSGWECDPTNVGGAFYSKKKNVLILVQFIWNEDIYDNTQVPDYNLRFATDDFEIVYNKNNLN